MIHLLLGPDRFLVHEELGRLLGEYDPDGLNTTRFDKSAEIGEIASAVATVGFFGTGRVVVAEGALARASGTAKSKKADAEAVTALLAAVAAGNRLILVDPEISSVPKAIKDALTEHGEIFVGSVPRGSELVRWTQAEAKRLGGSIEPRAAHDVLPRLFPGRWARAENPPFDKPPDLATLSRALETLLLYAGDRPISSEDVETMVSTESSDQMFAFTDSVFAGEVARSLKLLQEEGLDDDSAVRLLGYAGTQAELALVVAGVDRNESLLALGKDIGGASEGRLARLRRSISAADATAVGRDLAAADRRMKTGRVRGVQGQLFDLLIARAQGERGR